MINIYNTMQHINYYYYFEISLFYDINYFDDLILHEYLCGILDIFKVHKLRRATQLFLCLSLVIVPCLKIGVISEK